MRAVVCRAFGPPEELETGELPAPEPGDPARWRSGPRHQSVLAVCHPFIFDERVAKYAIFTTRP